MTATTHLGTISSLFDFFPQPRQDSDLLETIGFLPGVKELLMLRQVHALEHATVWMLSELTGPSDPVQSSIDDGTLSGLSTDQGFYLYGHVPTLTLHRAVQKALRRLIQGEWQLAIHPRCGTNVSVNLMLTVSLALGAHILLPRGPIEQLFGLGLAAGAAAQMTPDIGNVVQRHITTAIPFNLAVESIRPLSDHEDHPGHFVRVRWIEA